MKKLLSNVIVLLTVLALMLSFAGCMGKDTRLVGTWQGDIEATEIFNKMMKSEDEELAKYFKFEDIKFTVCYEFSEDGTYKSYADEEEFKDDYDRIIKALENGLEAYLLEAIIPYGFTSLDEYFAASNTSMEDLTSLFKEELNINTLLEEFKGEGNYELKNNKLFMSDGVEYAIDEEVYEVVEFDGDDKIKITESVDPEATEEDKEMAEIMYPFALVKK